MKKLLKIMGILIVIGVVVFSAGCASKKTETTNKTNITTTNVSTESGPKTPVTTEVPTGNVTTEKATTTNVTTTNK
jgi:hypothetical protein